MADTYIIFNMKNTQSQIYEKIEALNPPQKQAVLHREGPMLVLAGAGSGKTRVVTLRIAHLIESDVDPRSILGLTFTNKAAQEMKHRVHSFVQRNVLISTFHSLGAKILREVPQYLGLSPEFQIYDEEDSNKLLKSASKIVGVSVKTDLKMIRGFISSCKNKLISPEEAETLTTATKEFSAVYSQYAKMLKECNAIDFDDLIMLPVILFSEHKEVLSMYQQRWPYVLVDEYQDTNKAQYAIIKYLTETKKNLFVVGDPDQSIYSWRGATIQNILNFEEDFPGATVTRLEQNYRSTEVILHAANAVIRNNQSRYEKSLWTSSQKGEKICVMPMQTEREEASKIADIIIDLHRNKDVPLKQIAIFYRTNFQSRSFEDALISRKIPYTVIGGVSFYSRREVKDILALLKLLENPSDIISFMRIINLPKRGFGEVFLEKILEQAKEEHTPIAHFILNGARENFSTIKFSLSSKQKEGWIEFASILSNLDEQKKNGTLSELIASALYDSNYTQVLDDDQETKDERRGNLEQLIVKAQEWEEEKENPTLSLFLEEIALLSSWEENKANDDRVFLMTAHNGKGLEFEVVFLVGLEEDLFPHTNSKKSNQELEEERRLFYVGITRAKKELFMSFAGLRNLWGSQRSMRPSRFINEIPKELLYYKKKENLSFEKEIEVTEAPAPIKKPISPRSFSVGELVLHPHFGVGKIITSQEASAGLTYEIHFINDGKKRKLVASLAPLSSLIPN